MRRHYSVLHDDSHTRNGNAKLRTFADDGAEANFRASFFRQNIQLHMFLYIMLIRPDVVLLSLTSEPVLSWNIAAWTAAIPILILYRACWLHKLNNHHLAQRISLVLYATLTISIFGPDAIMILAGYRDVTDLLPWVLDPRISSIQSLWSFANGMLQSSHAPSSAVEVTICAVVFFDQLLSLLLLFQSGKHAEMSTILTYGASYGIGVVCMRIYASVLREQLSVKAAQLRAQEQVAAYLFHEIRNHQAAQNGVLQVVLDHVNLPQPKPVPPDVALMVSDAFQHSRQGIAVIENMLSFAKARAGKLSCSREQFNLAEMLEECLTLVKFMLKQSSELKLCALVEIDDSLTNLVGPVGILKQVLVNLLSNAIKYTSRGHVLLRAASDRWVETGAVGGTAAAELVPDAGALSQIVLSVEDTGCGISLENQRRIFDPYVQGFRPGTGLGLPLCKELAMLMGTDVKISSSGTGGSIFSMVLTLDAGMFERAPAPMACEQPLVTAHSTDIENPDLGSSCAAPPTAVATGPDVSCAAPRVRVLVADDMRLNRVILISQFKCIWPTAFFVEVGSAEQALARLKDGLMIGPPFTHAFLDEFYSGEETTGTEITRLYRRAEQEQELIQSKTFRAVVVGCTADASNVKHLQSAQEAGQNFVIGKPLPSTDEMERKLSSC